MEERRAVQFGMFEADLRTEELRRHGRRLRLPRQAFQVLALLLERPGELATREQLRERIWPGDTFVDFDHGLNAVVNRLRDVLGDSADAPRFIETLPKRGYRFIGQIATNPPETASSETRESAPFSEPAGTMWLRPRTRRLAAVVAVVLTIGTAAAWWWRVSARPASYAIAVLPLENLSGDPGQDYFADGITDALITDLAQISSLRVISRSSVMHYKTTRAPLRQIAKELGVNVIVEGSVIRSGERVRVDAHLIETSTDRYFWARSYERSLGDVIALQNEVARAIANEVQAKLTPQENARLLRTDPVDPQTYELYLKGRYLCGKRTDDSIRKGIDYLQQAVQRRPDFALAHAAIAEGYVLWEDVPPEEAFSRARTAARTALQMDDTLAEAHNALAAVLFFYDWDWVGAEREFQRALALNPNDALAHQWYGQLQKALGRHDWAAEVKRAGELDPLSIFNAGGAWYIESGQPELALEVLRKKLELDPNAASPHRGLGRWYTRQGMYAEAIEHLQKAVALSGGEPNYLSALGYAHGVSGNRSEALKSLQQLAQLSQRRYVSPFYVALVYSGLGDKNMAFAWLQKAVIGRSTELVFIKGCELYGEMDSLRSDPRYADLKRQIGLPE